MHAMNAYALARLMASRRDLMEFPLSSSSLSSDDVSFGTFWWFAFAGTSLFLVLFGGIMSGLTLGLMSLGIVDLEILQRSGTPTEKKQALITRVRTLVVPNAGGVPLFKLDKENWKNSIHSIDPAAIIPVVKKQHQLLVTLLLCNACSMEALPLCLDKILNPFISLVMSVTFVLAFGEVIPQAICTRYGLAVGANCVWLVRVLMILCFPIAYPIAKLLDYLLGHDESALFRRAQLKALVSIHGKEAGKGGELSHDETTIISGALDLTEKTAEEAMTPIESTFSLDVNSKLDWEVIGRVLARGHSRVPVYSGNPKNIIGLLLVKSLLTVRAETETPVSAISIRRIPRVPGDMPLYDILNEFQKGSSHMAAVVKAKGKSKSHPVVGDGEKSEENRDAKSSLTTPLLSMQDKNSESIAVKIENGVRPVNANNSPDSLQQNASATNVITNIMEYIEEAEVIGIITLEDVFEELLQEEIVDETDEFVDVHKRIRVAAAAAASSVARLPSSRRLTGHKGVQNRQGGTALRKSADDDSSPKIQENLVEPLHGTKR